MERQPGRSAAVAQFGRVGCLGASQSLGLRRQASWLKVWRGGRCKFSATERAHKQNEGQLTRNAGCQVWSRSRKCNGGNFAAKFAEPQFCLKHRKMIPDNVVSKRIGPKPFWIRSDKSPEFITRCKKQHQPVGAVDRKSTRLNSSHLGISYA